ncbi:MAG: SDR family NAD(P)-dependent oxidoreductase [Bacteroidales bacterium]|nr:SDR family NAD(P)-dependent oxidoreductase [Bacteroidales bacterium]
MRKKTILLTGATSGIGRAAALEFAKMGYELIVPVRNSHKAQKLIQDLMTQASGGNIKTYKCDFNSINSLKQFVEEVKTDCQKIDVLINNAGLWNKNRAESVDDIEQTFAVNVLAPYYLTRELLPLVEKGDEKRIIFTSSELHGGAINFDDIEFKKSYTGFLAYQQSKLADLLLSRQLAEKWRDNKITVNSFHPGVISTGLADGNGFLAKQFFKLFGKTPKKGAETLIYLATNSEAKKISGEYFAKSKVKNTKGNSNNMEMAAKLITYLDDKLKDLEKLN